MISISLCILIAPANIIVVFLRLTSSKRSANSLTIINLAISDAVQGIYLGLIISNDLLYHETYGLTKSEWKKSFLCSAIGFLALLCATLSASSAIIIALDRHKIIATPFLSVSEGSGKGTRILIIILTWVLCSIVSYVPFMPYTAHIYQTILSDICFVHLYDTKYSTSMFVYVNQLYGVLLPILYFIVTGIYIRAVYKLWKSGSNLGRRKNYTTMYIKFTLICTTYIISSMTIAIITYLADAGMTVETYVANGILLFFSTFPAAVNPFLYTIATSYITDYFNDKKTAK